MSHVYLRYYLANTLSKNFTFICFNIFAAFCGIKRNKSIDAQYKNFFLVQAKSMNYYNRYRQEYHVFNTSIMIIDTKHITMT